MRTNIYVDSKFNFNFRDNMNGSVIYIMGVSGSGKTLIGQKLSRATGIPFFDGDDFHSTANKKKMQEGYPLTDEDREEWLMAINHLAKNEAGKKGAIIACSALKEKYRLLLSQDINTLVHWVFLQGDFQLINERIQARKDHFMPALLLESQFETLEIPRHAIVIDIANSPGRIIEEIIKRLNLRPE
ncbi:MAG: gluconokinase [Bacteroidota bacterium]|nr:gluconokinase [Bacteroidota bacterium]